jgi:hypothetical protein
MPHASILLPKGDPTDPASEIEKGNKLTQSPEAVQKFWGQLLVLEQPRIVADQEHWRKGLGGAILLRCRLLSTTN